MTSIQAAVLREPGRPLRIERLEMEDPRPDEVLVRLVASGICHTDIDFCESGAGGAVVLGHEGSGVIERTGRAVRGLKPGDHVVLSFQSCGACRACRKGRPADCERFYEANFGFARLDGTNAFVGSDVRGHFFGQSSFATYALATARNAVRVPKRFPLELVAPLGCGLQTGAGTVMNSLAVKAGASIAILGAGSVGLAAVMAACIVRAQTIVAVDIKANRLKLALQLGATHTINSRRCDVDRSLAGVAGDGLDHVIDTVGDEDLQQVAVERLKPDGAIALLTGGGGPSQLPGRRRVLNVIQGDAVPQHFIPKLIRLYSKGLFPFDRLVRFYEFAEINRAIEDSQRGNTIKPVLRIWAEPAKTTRAP